MGAQHSESQQYCIINLKVAKKLDPNCFHGTGEMAVCPDGSAS